MSDCGHFEYLQSRAARVAARNPHLARKIMGLPPAYAAPKEHRIEVDCRTGERKVIVLTPFAKNPKAVAPAPAVEAVILPPKPQNFAPADAFAPKREDVKTILRTVADVWGVNLGRILSEDRTRSIAYPRFAAMWLVRERVHLSHTAMGRLVFKRDHTSALFGVRRAQVLHDTDPDWRAKYDAVVALLDAGAA